jgi:hypothetical protein
MVGNFGPDGFEVAKAEDQGLGVKKFEEDIDRNAIVSERTWLLTLKGKEGQKELPKTFHFASVRLPAKEVIYQRYADADLAPVGEEVSLEQSYGKRRVLGPWAVAGLVAAAVLLLLLAALAVALIRRGESAPADAGLPERLDPFVAASLLREIRERPELSHAQRAALDQDLAEIERHYFAAGANGQPAPDLRGIVERWAAAVPGWKAPARRPVAAAVV